MDSISINKVISYEPSINMCEKLITKKDKPIATDKDDSDISNDGVMLYTFLKRIENSTGEGSKISSIPKYASEYEKIEKEISSGAYGNETKKFKDLLDNAYKDALDNFSKSLTISKTSNNTNINTNSKIKMSSANLLKCQKQYETGTTITWILQEENKRISHEIEHYKKKKDTQKVNSLTELKHDYEHVINNISNTTNEIMANINDHFNSDEHI